MTRTALVALLFCLHTGCDAPVAEPKPADTGQPDCDADGDGFISLACGGSDCDDSDPAVYPGAEERCNGIDDNCDGVIDQDDAVDASTWYRDADGDGFGDPAASARTCLRPEGYVANATDCDDEDDRVYPGAQEVCDGADNNCDGRVDEGVRTTFYADTDGDGYGDLAVSVESCEAPVGYVEDGTDCDDQDDRVYPGAEEVCDGVDNSCDGRVDEGLTLTWYRDTDGDGYGDPGVTTESCYAPVGYSATGGDCDDGDASVYPGADEWCNGVDDNCDGVIDEDDALDALTWYRDADGDGYGDLSTTTTACLASSGWVDEYTDCDDGDATIYPGATEICDGLDQDCDGVADNGVLGTGAACPALDCSEILDDDPTAASNWYHLDAGTYWCDQSSYGGGWTMVGQDVAVWGTSYDTTFYNSEGFTWTEVLFAYSSGSVHAHCTYPSSLTGCNNLGFQFGSESWGVPLNWGSSLCGMSTTSYTGATTYVGGYDFVVERASSTDTIRLGTLEGVASCTISDNPGVAYAHILVRR